jgi:regulator of RNase E activity RraA
MMPRSLTAEWIRALRAVDTPTVCNALELAMGGRTAHGFTYGTVIAAPQPLPSFLGFVRTARIRASTASPRSPLELRQMRLDYYRYVAASDPAVPVVVVMQDDDVRPGTGSFWGEVNSAVHEALGVAGVLTNGSVRDLGDLSPTFPILAGSVGPSHAHVRVEAFGAPVNVFGLALEHDALIHADRHGAVRIPPEHIDALPACIALVQRKEAPLLGAARSGSFTLALLEQAMSESDDIH